MDIITHISEPLISVVVPTYNRATLLPACIDSVLAMRWSNLEIIVVDDGSTDQTAEVVKVYGDRIRYHRIANSGAAVARNVGLSLAVGEFVQFVDSDDLLLPDKFAVEAPRLIEGFDLVFGDYAFFLEDPAFYTRVIKGKPATDWIAFFFSENTQTAVPLHRRTTLVASGGWRLDCAQIDDYELHLRQAFLRNSICYVPGVRSIVRDHEDTRLTQNPAGVKVIHRILVEYGDKLLDQDNLSPERCQGLAERLWRIVVQELHSGDRAQATRVLADLRRFSPFFNPHYERKLPQLMVRILGAFEMESLKWNIKAVLQKK